MNRPTQAGTVCGARQRAGWPGLWLALLACSALILAAPPLRAEPLVGVLHGAQPDGSTRFIADLGAVWSANPQGPGSALVGVRVAAPRQRLKGLLWGRGQFAVLDAGSAYRLRDEFPDVAAVSVLWPTVLQVLTHGGEAQPLRSLPAAPLAYLAGAMDAVQGLIAPPTPGVPASGGPVPGGTLPPQRSAPPATPLPAPIAPDQVPQLLTQGVPWLVVQLPAPTLEIVQALQRDPAWQLLSLAPATLDALRASRPWLQALTLPRGSYPNQREAVNTVAEPLLLLAPNALPDDQVLRMLDCLYQHRDAVAAFDPLFAAIDRRSNAAVAKWMPFHPAAAKQLGLTAPSS